MASKAIASYRYYLDIPPTSTAYAGRTAQIVLFDANNGYVGVINFLKTSTYRRQRRPLDTRSTFSTVLISGILWTCCAMRHRCI